MKNKDLPVIFIFDLDSTLIGQSSAIYNGYKKLLDFIADKCKHQKLDGPICDIDKDDWKEIIPNNLFRPHLKQGLDNIKSLYPTAEFFIFSLGIKEYVTSLVKIIENRFDVKFNRPIFAREDASLSGTYSHNKDIAGYQDTICKSLAKKYPKVKQEKYKNIIFKDRTIIIDDNSTVWMDDPRYIICKAYEYNPIYIIHNKIIEIIIQNPIVQNFINQSHYLHMPNVYSSTSLEEYMLDYHMYLANQYRINRENNSQQLKDDFFVKFVNTIRKRKHLSQPFTADYIKKIKNSFL
jgi:hypothetical protein